jgi:hypothetical protein
VLKLLSKMLVFTLRKPYLCRPDRKQNIKKQTNKQTKQRRDTKIKTTANVNQGCGLALANSPNVSRIQAW